MEASCQSDNEFFLRRHRSPIVSALDRLGHIGQGKLDGRDNAQMNYTRECRASRYGTGSDSPFESPDLSSGETEPSYRQQLGGAGDPGERAGRLAREWRMLIVFRSLD